LIHRIAQIDDEIFLRAIKTILVTKLQPQMLVLTNEQKSEILASRKDVDLGIFIEQADLDIEFNKWLSKR